VVTSVAGLFYYLRIVVALFSDPPEHAALTEGLSRGGALILAGLAVVMIWLGVYPSPLLDLIRASLVGLN